MRNVLNERVLTRQNAVPSIILQWMRMSDQGYYIIISLIRAEMCGGQVSAKKHLPNTLPYDQRKYISQLEGPIPDRQCVDT